jgi:Zn-dependent protease
VVLHELAHGLVADALGDPTPRRMGRLTLNPLAHIDWVGLLMLAVFKFGWAKPVIVNPRYFRHPRLGMLWVAVAGPAMNVLVALLALLVPAWLHLGRLGWGGAVAQGIFDVNVYLAVFNILPVPPLDGSKVLAALGGEAERLVYALDRFGWVILLVAVYFGFLSRLLIPMASGLAEVLYRVAAHLVSA